MGLDSALQRPVSRRAVLKVAASTGLALSARGILEVLAVSPNRLAHAAPATLPDIQFDIGAFIAPAQTINGVPVRFGPVFTRFVTLALSRNPRQDDQEVFAEALDTIESRYAFSPQGLFTFVAYGIPYFKRLPGGMRGSLVRRFIPRLRANPNRFALEEAIPSPTDISPLNPGITKLTFNVPVRIEHNDVLLTLRSDVLAHTTDVLDWLVNGSNRLKGKPLASPRLHGLFRVTSNRIMFQQIGLPRKVADQHHLPFAADVNGQSPMWMGFADQHTDGSGPADITTFQGNRSARLTTCRPRDYFANGAIQHLSHVIQDLVQFYAAPDEPFTERVQYLFRSDPIPALGNTDQFTDGGGPAFLKNVFQGTDDAFRNAAAINTFEGQHRMGHLAALQRSSRAADSTPIHIRMDGPGFDSLDVPDGTDQGKLQFTVFVPTADFFTTMRRNQASLDLVQQHGVADENNGLERFITATRRQNFLVPPRRHRAFPLLELADDNKTTGHN
jgi:hypothetical protein